MRRRSFLGGAIAAAVTGGVARPVVAHTPYRQWVVYRQAHLLVGSHRADPPSFELARIVKSVLDAHLPDAQCRVARAPNAHRLASLIQTGQLDVAVLSPSDAVAMRAGTGVFDGVGPNDIAQLARLGAHVLAVHGRLPPLHAELIVHALRRESEAVELVTAPVDGLPLHPAMSQP